VAFFPDGRLLASGSDDRTVRVWDVETGTEVRLFGGQMFSGRIRGVAVSPDGERLAAGTSDGKVKNWEVSR